MKKFVPDYRNIVDAAKNVKPKRLPLYEHNISVDIMEKILNKKFLHFFDTDLDEFFRHYCEFCEIMGYDVVTFEVCAGESMPYSGALGGHKEGHIKTMQDFKQYPWDEVCDRYFERAKPLFEALRRQMPEGMKGIGGVGNGVFECVQDLTGYMQLCYIGYDDRELYESLFYKIGDILSQIWEKFLKEYGDIYCVCRFGDDLGFNTTSLLSADDIRELIIPQYKRIVEIVHKYDKPFLLHSCGCIFNVMDDIIDVAKIDAKHSNEDSIAPFQKWIDDYGSKIGNFGGIDTNVLCDIDHTDLDEYVSNIVNLAMKKNGGVAIGSGNSIPDYVSPKRYQKAVNIVRKMRGDDQ